jgi:hypothetical protein
MICKACSTRLGSNDRFCPNCGRTASPGSSLSGVPSVVAEIAALPPEPLPPAAEAAPGTSGSEELDLSEAVDLEVTRITALELAPAAAAVVPPPVAAPPASPDPEQTRAIPPAPAPPARREPVAPAFRVLEPPAPAARVAEPPPAPGRAPEPLRRDPAAPARSRPAPAASYSIFTLRPEELRARIVERPEMVERGLTIYRDPSTGRVTGVGFETEVGDIDLLGVDEAGALVVVMVCERTVGDPVAPVLERLGWVAKHVARPGQAARAVVLLEPPPPTLGYSARAVAETVAFKTYKVAVAVEDVEI